VSAKYHKILEGFKELFKSDKNSRNFRRVLQTTLTPCIPHLGTILLTSLLGLCFVWLPLAALLLCARILSAAVCALPVCPCSACMAEILFTCGCAVALSAHSCRFLVCTGIFLQDLTFIEDGNPDEFSNMINFNKRCV
jgi:hypothetical protein